MPPNCKANVVREKVAAAGRGCMYLSVCALLMEALVSKWTASPSERPKKIKGRMFRSIRKAQKCPIKINNT